MCESSATGCRLLIDPPSDGAWNMAVDEYLLGWTAETGRCCWRFYQWREPTLSLGYFQEYGDREHHTASRQCAVVRRASGGGAILHDAELTYSFTVPETHRLARRRQWMYEAVHETLIAELAHCGVDAGLFGDGVGAGESGQSPKDFLCFQRRSAGDIVVAGTKIVGSAQRRVAGAVLQHGSILLNRGQAAPELAGLAEVTGVAITPEDLIERWQPRIGQALGLEWAVEPLTAEERRAAEEIVTTKYGCDDWTVRRNR